MNELIVKLNGENSKLLQQLKDEQKLSATLKAELEAEQTARKQAEAECAELLDLLRSQSTTLAAQSQELANLDFIQIGGVWLRKSAIQSVEREPGTGGSRINQQWEVAMSPDRVIALLAPPK